MNEGEARANFGLFDAGQAVAHLMVEQRRRLGQKIDRHQPLGEPAHHGVTLDAGGREFAELFVQRQRRQWRHIAGGAVFGEDLGEQGCHVGGNRRGFGLVGKERDRIAPRRQGVAIGAGLALERAEAAQHGEFDPVAAPGEPKPGQRLGGQGGVELAKLVHQRHPFELGLGAAAPVVAGRQVLPQGQRIVMAAHRGMHLAAQHAPPPRLTRGQRHTVESVEMGVGSVDLAGGDHRLGGGEGEAVGKARRIGPEPFGSAMEIFGRAGEFAALGGEQPAPETAVGLGVEGGMRQILARRDEIAGKQGAGPAQGADIDLFQQPGVFGNGLAHQAQGFGRKPVGEIEPRQVEPAGGTVRTPGAGELGLDRAFLVTVRRPIVAVPGSDRQQRVIETTRRIGHERGGGPINAGHEQRTVAADANTGAIYRDGQVVGAGFDGNALGGVEQGELLVPPGAVEATAQSVEGDHDKGVADFGVLETERTGRAVGGQAQGAALAREPGDDIDRVQKPRRLVLQFDDPGLAVALHAGPEIRRVAEPQNRGAGLHKTVQHLVEARRYRLKRRNVERARLVEHDPERASAAEHGGGHGLVPCETKPQETEAGVVESNLDQGAGRRGGGWGRR